MKQLFCITIFLALFCNVYAQEKFDLSGKVIDENSKFITIGDALLLNKEDGKIIKYASVIEGQFLIENIQKAEYILKISCLGFKKHKEPFFLDKDLNVTITLKESETALEEVEVIVSKKPIEYNNGNIKVNISNTILSSESNPVDLLSKLPTIQISPDRSSISIVGRGNPLIYLGNQRISMDELNALSIDSIENIEIINNPSVKYEAEGRSVLLINRKAINGKGFIATFSETASFKTYFNNFFNTNANFKKNKLELKFNAAYNQLKVWESNSLDYKLTTRNTSSNYLVEAVTTRPQFVFGGGFYYQINKSDYISLNSTLRTQRDPFYIDTNTFLNDNGLENNIKSFSDNIGRRNFSSSNINYFKALNKTNNLFVGAQYSYFNQSIENSIQNTYDNPFRETFLDRFQDFKVNTFSARADYGISFKKDRKLEFGTNYTNTISKSLNEIESASTNYKYSEENIGLYSQFSGKVKKVNYSLGARVEKTKVAAGFEENNAFEIDRDNTFFFPKGNINFSIDSTKTVTLNYAKSISRPNFSTASSTAAFINPVLEFRGNLLLKPTLTDEISATFQRNDKSLTLGYSYKKNSVHYSLIFDYEDGITVMFPSNFEREFGFNLDLVIPLKYKLWRSTNVLSFNLNTIDDPRAVSIKSTPYLYYYSNHQFKINNTSSIGINGWGKTNRIEGIFNRKAIFVLNASISKKFNTKWNATLSFNDIFNSMEFQENYELQGIEAKNFFFTDANEVAITLKYSFGKIKKSNFKNKNIDENINRIR